VEFFIFTLLATSTWQLKNSKTNKLLAFAIFTLSQGFSIFVEARKQVLFSGSLKLEKTQHGSTQA